MGSPSSSCQEVTRKLETSEAEAAKFEEHSEKFEAGVARGISAG